MEKLRKALEKKTAVIRELKAGKRTPRQEPSTKNFSSHSEPSRPFAGDVEDANQLHDIATNAIRNDVGRP